MLSSHTQNLNQSCHFVSLTCGRPSSSTRRLRPRHLLNSTLFFLLSKAVSTFSVPSPTTVGHQRYVYAQGPSTKDDNSNKQPPLLILPGTAQSIEVWEQHLPTLTKTRSVIICEPLGCGLTPLPEHTDLTLSFQAETLKSTLQSIPADLDGPLDMVGFSLGGRIAMAFACMYPDKVNRLHLTGVGLHRSIWGAVQIEAWKDILEHSDDLRAFAWSALLASYSPEFLLGQKDKLTLWIDGVCQRHTVNGLRRLVQETIKQDEGTEWSVAAMAKRLPSHSKGRLCVGQGDLLAPVGQVEALAKMLQWPEPTVIPRSGHVPPIENARAWRKDLEDFLNLSGN